VDMPRGDGPSVGWEGSAGFGLEGGESMAPGGGQVSDGRCICISISSIATGNQKLARMSEIFGRP
jgi:hypothetical protein